MVDISVRLFAERLTGGRVVVADQFPWLGPPFTFEFREPRMSVGHFAKIKPAEAGLTGLLDRERQNRVVWAQRKILSPGSVESIGNRLSNHQKDRARQQLLVRIPGLFGEQQLHEPAGVHRIPQSLEE